MHRGHDDADHGRNDEFEQLDERMERKRVLLIAPEWQFAALGAQQRRPLHGPENESGADDGHADYRAPCRFRSFVALLQAAASSEIAGITQVSDYSTKARRKWLWQAIVSRRLPIADHENRWSAPLSFFVPVRRTMRATRHVGHASARFGTRAAPVRSWRPAPPRPAMQWPRRA